MGPLKKTVPWVFGVPTSRPTLNIYADNVSNLNLATIG